MFKREDVIYGKKTRDYRTDLLRGENCREVII